MTNSPLPGMLQLLCRLPLRLPLRRLITYSVHPSIPDASGKEMSVALTPAAFRRLVDLARDGLPPLRVAVDSGGCRGLTYTFALCDPDSRDAITPEDIIITAAADDDTGASDRVRVVVDPESMEYVAGATVDWVDSFTKRAFTVKENPRAQSGCGCGVSFDVK